jgi:hypothetical protein
MCYGLDGRGSIPSIDKRFFSILQRPDRHWVPLSLQSYGYRWLFPRGSSGGMKSVQYRVQELYVYILTAPYILVFIACSLIDKIQGHFTCCFCVSQKHLTDRLCGLWSEFLATDPEIAGSIPGVTRFPEK